MSGQLARHTSNLSIANLLVTIAGVVSFPVLTRVLSVDDYGVMNFVATALALVVTLAKLGVQHASLRFYADALSGVQGRTVRVWAATVVFGMGATGAVVALAWAIVVALLPASTWGDERIPAMLLLTASLLLVRALESAATSLLRAQERTGTIALFAVVRRYLVLGGTLGALMLLSRSLYAFFGAMLVVEVLAIVALLWRVHRATPLAPSATDAGLYRAMLAFGVPMVGVELSTVVLTMGDRYLIQRLLGGEALGLYTASYNLCDYVKTVALAGLVQALQPMYLRTWGESGRVETEAMLAKVTRIYALLALPTVAGLAGVADVLLPILASEKYAGGTPVVPWVIAAMAFDAFVVVASAGLVIGKRTRTMLGILACAATLNVALNLVLIPAWGIVGAGVSTLATSVAIVVASRRAGRSIVAPPLPLGQLVLPAAAAAVMYAIVVSIHLDHAAATLAARIAAGALAYSAAILAFDREARGFAGALVARIKGARP